MMLPNTWKSLKDFAIWYKQNNYPQLPPKIPQVYQTDVSLSVCVFRHGPFQVEFYIAKPGFTSSKHYHPFEQVIIFMGGSGKGRRGLNLNEETVWWYMNPPETGKISEVLMPNQWHQICSLEHGLYFYNCQLWPEKTNLTSAVVEYNGDSLGPIHNQIISNKS